MTSSLPDAVQATFDRFLTTEYTTIDRRGQPITWPVTPYYRPGDDVIDVTTGLGYPKKAADAAANPKVSLLFSDPTGSALDDPPMVLVQGIAVVDDADLAANRRRYGRESIEKLPGIKDLQPPEFMKRYLGWYYDRIYVHVRPERIYVWAGCDSTREPTLFDAHMEEVRSGHDEEEERPQAAPDGSAAIWDDRIEQIGGRYEEAVLTVVAPDGFPFSVRLPMRSDAGERVIRVEAEPLGPPLAPGLACVAAHEHDPEFRWQRNFQVRGDLVEGDGGWAVVPHKVVGGFEVPDGRLALLRENFGKAVRFRRTAKRELAKRGR